ncbi:MAG: hypothetical protein OXR67_15105 [Chloroflexota bacterium]|nr:hypothetical protein [Chloroflexota bacterium]
MSLDRFGTQRGQLIAIVAEVLSLTEFSMFFDRDRYDGEGLKKEYDRAKLERSSGHWDAIPWEFLEAEADIRGVPEHLILQFGDTLQGVLDDILEWRKHPDERTKPERREPDRRISVQSWLLDRLAQDGPLVNGYSSFLGRFTKCAALYGVEPSVDFLFAIVLGEPTSYDELTVLEYVKQENDFLELSPDIHLLKIGAQGSGLIERIPMNDLRPSWYRPEAWPTDGESPFSGYTLLCCHDVRNDPVPGGRNRLSMSDSGGHRSPSHLLTNALALVGNSPVRRMQGWIVPDPKFACLVNGGVIRVEYIRRGTGTDFEVTPSHLETAHNIFLKCKGWTPQGLMVPTSRWWDSLSTPEFALVDIALDLRIALETTFSTSNPELSFRLAVQGAWYLGTDGEERVRIFKTLRKAYDICSKAAHSGRIDMGEDRARQTLFEARDICRRGIIKRLTEGGGEPQWNQLILDSHTKES